jgi:hypothetical protein
LRRAWSRVINNDDTVGKKNLVNTFFQQNVPVLTDPVGSFGGRLGGGPRSIPQTATHCAYANKEPG